MKKILLYALAFSCLAIPSCRIYILNSEWEKVENYKANPNQKPSEIVNKYLGSKGVVCDSTKRYCIDIFDPACHVTNHEVPYQNKLYNATKDKYEWIAVTNYDSATVAHCKDVYTKIKCTKKSGINPKEYRTKITREYPVYCGILGLRSELRNLYYANNPPEDYSSMLIIVVNDSIIRITSSEEPIINEEMYIAFKNYLDSVVTSQTTLKK